MALAAGGSIASTGSWQPTETGVVQYKTHLLNDADLSGLKYPAVRLRDDDDFCEIVDLNALFRSVRRLGKGTYGEVFLVVERETNLLYALKFMSKRKYKTAFDVRMLFREFAILGSVRHPNIVHNEDRFETRTKFILQMEYCSGGELVDYVLWAGKVAEHSVLAIMIALFKVLAYLHERGVVHRDLKLENVLLSRPIPHNSLLYKIVNGTKVKATSEEIDRMLRDYLRVSDFGVATFASEADGGLMATRTGTLTFMAPEIVSGHAYSTGVDMWSAGVIMYLLLSGRSPFYDDSDVVMSSNIVTANYEFPRDPFRRYPLAVDLISHLLQPDPFERFTAQQALAHPWCQQSHWAFDDDEDGDGADSASLGEAGSPPRFSSADKPKTKRGLLERVVDRLRSTQTKGKEEMPSTSPPDRRRRASISTVASAHSGEASAGRVHSRRTSAWPGDDDDAAEFRELAARTERDVREVAERSGIGYALSPTGRLVESLQRSKDERTGSQGSGSGWPAD